MEVRGIWDFWSVRPSRLFQQWVTISFCNMGLPSRRSPTPPGGIITVLVLLVSHHELVVTHIAARRLERSVRHGFIGQQSETKLSPGTVQQHHGDRWLHVVLTEQTGQRPNATEKRVPLPGTGMIYVPDERDVTAVLHTSTRCQLHRV